MGEQARVFSSDDFLDKVLRVELSGQISLPQFEMGRASPYPANGWLRSVPLQIFTKCLGIRLFGVPGR